MQFRVPQFIDIEDKILGPLSWRQFAYVLGAGAFAYLALRLIPSKILALFIGGPFVLLFLALAFIRINDRPFVEILQNGFSFFTGGNIYTWQKESSKQETQNVANVINNKNTIIDPVIKYERKKLKEVAFGLDVKTNDNNAEEIEDSRGGITIVN